MTIYRILFLNLFISFTLNAFSQTYWKIENEHGDEILLTIEVNKSKNTFEAYSRKDALKDLAGVFTYTLAKAAGKLKYPEIVFIEGTTRSRNDTVLLSGDFFYFDKHFMFSASMCGSNFDGKYLDNRGNTHRLIGVMAHDLKPLKDYSAMISSAFQLTDQNIFNPLLIKSDEWLDFKKKVENLKSRISDDYELAATFFWLGKKLPFTPFEINKARPGNSFPARKNHVGIHEVKMNTVLMDGNSIPGTKKEMDSIANIVKKNGYGNLVIDLRGNSRLPLASAKLLLDYLADRQFEAGAYLTRKWTDHNPSIPKSQDYQKLLMPFKDSEFQSGGRYVEKGCYLNIFPTEKTFKGKVFLLTDSKTSRAAEMVTFTLKSRKIATIVGQKTAGLTVLAEGIKLNSVYDLILPDCDFYTTEGRSLNSIGIEPDMQKSGDEVMKYVLSVL